MTDTALRNNIWPVSEIQLVINIIVPTLFKKEFK